MVRTRQENEEYWKSVGYHIIIEEEDRQAWADDEQKELFVVDWSTEELQDYKLVDKYKRKSEMVK